VAGILWAAWLALSVWGLMRIWRIAPNVQAESTPLLKVPPASRGEPSEAHARSPLHAGGTCRRGFSIVRVRVRWLGDWRGWVLALSVASFAPALMPDASLPVQAALTLLAGAWLLRLMHALDSRLVGQGVVAGLGLIALVLDSLSGGVWARLGALGHGTEAHGVGLLYGTLALLWGLTVVRAWLRIEGNPLGAALGLGALACWLGWKGLVPPLGWGAAACALALGAQLLTRELAERRRVRLMLQNRLVRIVRRASNADLALTGGALVGLCLLALWLSGMPVPETPRLGAHAGWQAGVLVVVAVGMWGQLALTPIPSPTRWERGVKAHGGASSPSPALQKRGTKGVRADFNLAVFPAPALLALLGGEPLAVAALASLWFWANNPVGLQEYPPHAPNPTVRTGGNE
jgi:hypothetical protein